MLILLGPEAFWLVVYFVSAWFAGRNVAPGYPVNDALSWLYWVAPAAAVAVSFALCFQCKIPGPLTWWLLVRLTLAAAVGVCVVTNVLVERIEAGSGKPGLAMGMMVAIVLHLLVTGCASVTGLVMLLRSGNAAGSSLWTFVKQGAVVLAVIAGLLLLVSFVYDRKTMGMTGEDKRGGSRRHMARRSARSSPASGATGIRTGPTSRSRSLRRIVSD